MVIVVDVCDARYKNGLNLNEMAKMLGVGRRQLIHYERGTEIIPENILASLFYHVVCLKHCKKTANRKQ